MLKCDNCGSKIERANCYSQCVQTCTVHEDGTVTDFGSTEVLSTQKGDYECCECGADITYMIKE